MTLVLSVSVNESFYGSSQISYILNFFFKYCTVSVQK